MSSVIRILVKVVYFFYALLLQRVWYIFIFSVDIFAKIISTVSGSMELFKAKKFVMIGSWWKVEEDADHTVNNITETFYYMGFGVEVRKLNI